MNEAMKEIEGRAAAYADAQSKLDDALATLRRDLDEVRLNHMVALKRLSGLVARRESELRSLIETAPDLFDKPRTMIFHGVKVGFTTSKGKVVWADEEQVKKLIRKRFPELEEQLIKTTETVSRDAIRDLDETQMKAIGCRIDGAGDTVVLKSTAGDVEKMFAKWIAKTVEDMAAPEHQVA